MRKQVSARSTAFLAIVGSFSIRYRILYALSFRSANEVIIHCRKSGKGTRDAQEQWPSEYETNCEYEKRANQF